MRKQIRLFQPYLSSSELKAVNRVFKKSWIGFGEEVKKFEKEWCRKFKVKYSVAVNSCTAALHLSLLCNNFKKGKKVLVPSITFSATAASVLYSGLEPIFVDINKDNFSLL